MSSIEIGLLRHFPTDWNGEGRLQGRTDRPLTEAARRELAGLRLPPRWRGVRVLSSPLSRAVDTAEALAVSRVGTDERLMEMRFGSFEGKLGRDLLADHESGYGPVESWGWSWRPHGGESPEMVARRIAPLLSEIAAGGAPALLVCHRGVMRVVLALASGWRFDGPEPFRIKRAAIHPVQLAADGTPTGFGPPEPLTLT